MKPAQAPLQSYHLAWLAVHPERTAEWLHRMLVEGFQVHHIDGDHANDDPLNLVLIEGGDHMMLHNGKTRLILMPRRPTQEPKPKAQRTPLKQLRREIAERNNARGEYRGI